nr:hypothetical protein CFP56_33318 [Quercus suber]
MVGKPCKLGIAWACFHKANGVSFTHCCAKQVLRLPSGLCVTTTHPCRHAVSLCCIPASKALVPLVDSFLVDAPYRASAGPRSHPRVQRVSRGLRVANVDHVGMLMALDTKCVPLAPFANVPSEHHCSVLHDCHASLCPSFLSGALT